MNLKLTFPNGADVTLTMEEAEGLLQDLQVAIAKYYYSRYQKKQITQDELYEAAKKITVEPGELKKACENP